MTNDTIKEYLGKMVEVAREIDGSKEISYYGIFSNYDKDFITLSPFMMDPRSCDDKSNTKFAFDTLVFKKYKFPKEADRTNSKITIGRRSIRTIEEKVKPD